ncbi:MAG: DUF5119 domain-containing protein [Rikenellaceae bacterium]
MKTIIKNISLLLCVVAVFASCERKPIYDDCICNNKLAIPIDVDWETSGIELQNVTVLFYNAEDGTLSQEHKYEHNSNDIQSYAYLPEGSYTAVIFNELRDQIDYVSCVDYENLSTLKFETNTADPARSRVSTRSYVEQPGDLAVATVEGIVVTEAMILEAAYAAQNSSDTKSLSTETKATVESLMDVTTVKKNTTINISAHFDNIYYARMPSLVDLVNLADGYYVYGDKNSDSTATVQFTMNNRTYDTESFYNGTISTSVTAFGTLSDRTSTSGHDESTPVVLDVLFKLVDVDQTEVSYDLDVTSLIVHETLSDGSIVMTIDATFTEALPPVEPEGSEGDSGFGAEVEDWDEVDVPLTQ